MAYLDFEVWTDGLDSLPYRMQEAGTKAELALALQVVTDTEPFVPARSMILANRTQIRESDKHLFEEAKQETKRNIESGKPLIIYPGPYARFLYYGKLMIDPNTGSAWAANGVTKQVTGKDLQYSKVPHSRATSYWFEASKAQNLKKWVRVAGRAYGENL